jgi:hypothetical protein
MDNSELERLKSALKNVDSTGKKKEETTEETTDDYSGLNYNIDLSKLTSGYSGFSNGNSYSVNTIYTTNNTNPTWTSMPFSNHSGNTGIGQLELDGENADILINGRSLKEFMEKMEERLAILVPDPAKLEHFEALKRAYEHYKTLEALCELPKPEEKQ